jgi:hypothetical protein
MYHRKDGEFHVHVLNSGLIKNLEAEDYEIMRVNQGEQ